MQSLFQSGFLQALGYAIAHSVWQTAIVWLLYVCITGLISMSAAARYRMGIIAQSMGFIWFLFTFQFYYQQYHAAWQPLQNNATPQLQPVLPQGSSYLSGIIHWMLKGELLLPYISMAYLLLIGVLCIRWFMGYRKTQQIRYQGLQKMPAEWRLFVQRIATQLDIRKPVQVFLSEQVNTPLTIGFLKPLILVPVASINHLNTEQMEAVLLHELAHIKRYDYLFNLLLSVAEISLFFNPFTQLLSKAIRKERENSCDDWVLQFQYQAPVYAEALLRIAYLQQAPSLAMTATGKKNDLLYRVKRMTDQKENSFSYRKQLLALCLVTGILSSVAWLSPIHTTRTDQQTAAAKSLSRQEQRKQTYTVEPLAMTIENPLFNPVFFLAKPLQAEMKKTIASAEKSQETAGNADQKKITSLTPMVASALKLAALEMETQQPDWEKEIGQIEKAKQELASTLSADSIFLPANLRNQLRQDMNKELHHMSAEIRKAKVEMQKVFQENANNKLNKEKILRDVQKAMETVAELDKAGLDKIIIQSLQSVEPMLRGYDRIGHTADSKTAKTMLIEPIPEIPDVADPKEPLAVVDVMEMADSLLPFSLPVLSPLDIQRMQTELLRRLSARMHLQLVLVKNASEKQVQLIQLVHRKRVNNENRNLIVFQ
ncbi:MAG: M48 family metalloprotease [Bacteroidetes bacterium]|nr:M48 family metalloprotease [Bacteroidota bacterium]